MSETVKINLSKVIACMTIVLMAASVVGAGYIAYDNAKTAKTESAENRIAINDLKTRQTRFEGVMEERSRNQGEDLKELKSDMKTLLNNLELTGGKN